MTTTTPNSPDKITGRTPWDFAAELLITLQKVAPSAIVVAGFLVFGYFFYIEVNKARLEADKQLQAKLETAQAQLILTYEKMGGMSDQLIDNIEKLLSLNVKVDEDIESSRGRLKSLEQQKLAAEAEVIKLKRMQEDHDAKRRAAENALSNLEERRTALSVEIAEMRKRREEHEKNLADRAVQIAELKDEIKKLSAQDDSKSPEQKARAILRKFSSNPSSFKRTDLDVLIGLDLMTVDTIVKDGLGFKTWIVMESEDIDRKAYYGFTKPNNEESGPYLGLLLLKDRVSSVTVRDNLLLTRIPTVTNFYDSEIAGLTLYQDKYYTSYVESDRDKISLLNWPSMHSPEWSVRLIFGPDITIRVLQPTELDGRTDTIESWKQGSDPIGRPGLNLRMLQRAQEFSVDLLPGFSTASFPPELNGVVKRLLEAAVAKNHKLAASFVGSQISKKKLGEIAALVLQDGARFAEVKYQTAGTESGEDLAEVIIEFEKKEISQSNYDWHFAPLIFAKRGGSWILIDFEG